MSISRKLVLAFSVTIVLAVAAVASIAITEARSSAVDAFNSASLREIRQIDGAMTGFFDRMRESVAYLATAEVTRQADETVTRYMDRADSRMMTPLENGAVEADIFRFLGHFGQNHDALTYVYTGTTDGGFVQWPKRESPPNYDPRQRPWYRKAMAQRGEVVLTDAYRFATEDIIGVSLARTVPAPGGGVAGVQAVDVSLEQLTDMARAIRFGEAGYMLLVEDTGKVLVDPSEPEHNFEPLTGLGEPGYERLAAAEDGALTVSLGGESYQANIYTSQQLGWKFIGLIPRAEVMAPANRLSWQIAMIGLVSIVIVIGLAVWLSRALTRPINRVTERLRDIAAGEGDLTQRLPVEGRDEMSLLAEQFNAFAEKMRGAISEVDSTTHHLASAAEELNQVAGATRESVRSQSSETDQIASAINEMTATVQEISRNATEVEQAASEADGRARDGQSVVEENRESMRTLATDIERTSDAVAQLAERSKEIETVLDVIHEVTEQTNLLALNAAIEAARAGEQGRGFAVVAEEVRALAKRSSESADRIRTIIEGLVNDTRQAAETMDYSRERSERNVERAEDSRESLAGIAEAVTRIHTQITQVATAAEEQSQVAEEINRNVTRIVDAAGQSSEGMEQTSHASDELARMGETLRGVVGRFKV
ncbi:methyl-accepting chemotaxis protein [Arhodomonas sp. AD133]|uniref:methyl-accepting chemotaxis protein n=1 Tax=Arhodomonas sp. AD133 TaxID=3415009 RepID=UPI003EB7A963